MTTKEIKRAADRIVTLEKQRQVASNPLEAKRAEQGIIDLTEEIMSRESTNALLILMQIDDLVQQKLNKEN